MQGGAAEYAALIVYAVCFFLMFGFSFAYNMVPDFGGQALASPLRPFRHLSDDRRHLHRADGAGAGRNGGRSRWSSSSGAAPIVGVASKLFMPTRLDRGAVGFYLALSWSAIVAIKPLAATLPATALALIVAGGLIYSAGVPFYVWRSLKFQNAIWHACVALGAALQFGGVVAAIGAPS